MRLRYTFKDEVMSIFDKHSNHMYDDDGIKMSKSMAKDYLLEDLEDLIKTLKLELEG